MKDSVDFCDNQRCLNLVLGVEANDDCASPHLPSRQFATAFLPMIVEVSSKAAQRPALYVSWSL